jgi:hypothetical protein
MMDGHPGKLLTVRAVQEKIVPNGEALGLSRCQLARALGIDEPQLEAILAAPQPLNVGIHKYLAERGDD